MALALFFLFFTRGHLMHHTTVASACGAIACVYHTSSLPTSLNNLLNQEAGHNLPTARFRDFENSRGCRPRKYCYFQNVRNCLTSVGARTCQNPDRLAPTPCCAKPGHTHLPIHFENLESLENSSVFEARDLILRHWNLKGCRHVRLLRM